VLWWGCGLGDLQQDGAVGDELAGVVPAFGVAFGHGVGVRLLVAGAAAGPAGLRAGEFPLGADAQSTL
jgi:hypothetical protein